MREAKDRLIALGKAALQDAKDLYSVASSKAKERQEVRVMLTAILSSCSVDGMGLHSGSRSS